jgi:hypothetical protein
MSSSATNWLRGQRGEGKLAGQVVFEVAGRISAKKPANRNDN